MTRREVKRKLNRELKLTYWVLGKKWGVTSSMVSNYLNGRSVSARLDEKLAVLMNCSVNELPGKRKAA